MRLYKLIQAYKFTLFLIFILTPCASLANTVCDSTTERWGVKAGVQCIGTPGVTVTVTWQTATGPVTKTGTIGASGKAAIEAPAAASEGDSWSMTDSDNCVENGTQLAALMTPNNTALASHTIDIGTIQLDGQTFALSGNFEVIADDFDGINTLQGFIPANAFIITGDSTTTTDTVEIQLDNDQFYDVELFEALSFPFGETAFSSFSILVQGIIILNGVTNIPFTGLADGSSQYDLGPDSPEIYNVSLDLNTAAGNATGGFTSTGSVSIISNPLALNPVAVPLFGPIGIFLSTLMMLAIGLFRIRQNRIKSGFDFNE